MLKICFPHHRKTPFWKSGTVTALILVKSHILVFSNQIEIRNESLFPFLANPVVYTYQMIRVPVNS
jgi:hypothetical protein